MLKSFKKPLMIAHGCSFTDKNWTPVLEKDRKLDYSYPKWPELFGKENGYDVLNIGRSGSGNERISGEVMDAVRANPNTKLVCVLWSGWDRFLIGKDNQVPLNSLLKIRNKYIRDGKVDFEAIEKEEYDEIHGSNGKMLYKMYRAFFENFDLEFEMNKQMRAMVNLKEFLEVRGIKYVFIQGLQPYLAGHVQDFYNDLKIENNVLQSERVFGHAFAKHYFNSQYYEDFEEMTNDYFPGVSTMGTVCAYEFIWSIDRRYLFSKTDGHPNKKGHEMIAGYFKEVYEETCLND